MAAATDLEQQALKATADLDNLVKVRNEQLRQGLNGAAYASNLAWLHQLQDGINRFGKDWACEQISRNSLVDF